MMPLITVIIPVYNVEAYIRQCLDSVLSQTYKNLEIVLVDDGSTDESGRICDKYGEKDARIMVIHKRNGGLSDARNAALESCNGDYITFVDSDDYVSPCFIEVLLKGVSAEKCQIAALTGGVDFWDEKPERPHLAKSEDDALYKTYSSKKALEIMLYQRIATGAPFKIYKKDVFNEIRFPVGYYYEDVATTYKTFEKAENITIIDCPVYAYRKRYDSIIREKYSEKKLSALRIYEEIIGDAVINDWNLKEAAISRAFAMMYSVFLQVPSEMEETKIKIWDKLVECRKSVAFNKNKMMRKKNRYAAMISYLGMNISYFVGRKFGQKGSMK